MLDTIAELLGLAKKKNAGKKKPVKDYGGDKQEDGEGSRQPGSLARKGGRARQLREMEE